MELNDICGKLLESMSEVVFAVDYDGMFLVVNRKAAEFIGRDPVEIEGKLLSDVFPPSTSEAQLMGVRQVFDTREGLSVNAEIETPRGPVWFSVSLQPIMGENRKNVVAVCGVARDVSEYVKVRDALKIRDARFRELADMYPQIVFELDTAGYVTFANAHAFSITGYSQEDLDAGLHVLAIFPREEHDFIKNRIGSVLHGDEDVGEEYTLIEKNGASVPVMVYSSAIVHNGKPVGIRGIAVDITDRKKIEGELRLAYDNLRAEQRKLIEKNIALREVLARIDDEKREVREQIQTNISRLILPTFSELRQIGDKTVESIVDHLERNLAEIASPFVSRLQSQFAKLTPREMQVCDMVKSGMSSKAIADYLEISPLTVHKFRQNIRKKLGLSRSGSSLLSFLNQIK
jgi:PAS domain S-box-containing protein